jgi:hypothetical protein
MAFIVALLFPSGQFVPSFTRWIFVVFLAVQVPIIFLQAPPLIPNAPVSQPGWLVAASEFETVAIVQLYRYRRVSSPRERQQTKWVIFGLAVPIVVNVIVTVLYLIFPMAASSGSLSSLAYNVFGACWPLFIPLSFGFATLRNEVDLDQLRKHLLTAVQATMQPTHVSLWLRSPEQPTGNLSRTAERYDREPR